MNKSMTAILGVFLLVIFTGCATTSSLPSTEPSEREVKKANTILIRVDESPQNAYQNFAQYLSSKGFGFENTDESLRVFKTSMKTIPEINARYSLDVSVMVLDTTSLIRVSGNGTSNMVGDFEIVEGGDSNASGWPGVRFGSQAWDRMKEVVTSYPHINVLYQRN